VAGNIDRFLLATYAAWMLTPPPRCWSAHADAPQPE
jgi:hypothetical protein